MSVNQLIAMSGSKMALPQSFMEGASHMQTQRANELAMRKAQMEMGAFPETNRLANMQVQQKMRIGQKKMEMEQMKGYLTAIAPVASQIVSEPDPRMREQKWMAALPYVSKQAEAYGMPQPTPGVDIEEMGFIASQFAPESYRTVQGPEGIYQQEMRTGKAVAHPLGKKSPLIEQRLGGTKYEDERLKLQAKAVTELQKSAKNAYKNIQNLELFIKKSDKAQQGGLQPLITGVQNLFASVGVEFEDLTNVREMESVISEILANYMDQMGARGLTDQDMKILQAALPRINTDKNAREAVARRLQKVYAKDVEEYIGIREEEKLTPGLSTSILDRSWMNKYQSMDKPWLDEPKPSNELTYEDMLDPNKVSDQQLLQMINPQGIGSMRIEDWRTDERP